MEAVYINSKAYVLLSEDRPRDGAHANGARASRERAASDAGISSGAVATQSSAPLLYPHRPVQLSPPLSSIPTPTLAPLPSSLPGVTLQNTANPSSSLPAQSFSRAGKDGRHFAATVAPAVAHAAPLTSTSHLVFGLSSNTTPETSLVGARGKPVPLDNTATANRTSALRELNNNFPSPVFRHRHIKSAGAKSTTYSQPVIVRTYAGPSPSPSSSTHYRTPSSGYRAGSRAAGSRRIPLAPSSNTDASGIRDIAAVSSNNAHASGWGLTNSLFGMARSKGKKGSLIPWLWTGGADGQPQKEEAQLPPLEAFSFKGIMSDLQANTDIRSDLDRIAEICARSRYSLSNQYDSHMAPHGSGAGFAASGSQQAGRARGRRKGASSPGGFTLQAVASDDDEGGARGHRRRRGGIGGGRRRSTAYGTLETIMSSSRSSEEDKTKKKPAAEIAQEVRGRAARKTKKAAADELACEGIGDRGRDHQCKPGKQPQGQDDVDPNSMGQSASQGTSAPLTSRASDNGRGKSSRHRSKSSTFAHAMMDNSRQHQARHAATRSGSNSTANVDEAVTSFTVPALLSAPALPQASDGLVEVYSAAEALGVQNLSHGNTTPDYPSTEFLDGPGPRLDVVGADDGSAEDMPPLLDMGDPTSASFFSGLTHWIPWMGPAQEPCVDLWAGQTSQAQIPDDTEALLPLAASNNAEGSLRELLKTVEARKKNKGKAVDDGSD